MNYTQSITRRHRTAFVLAIDQSGSMVEELEFRGRRTSKAAAVAEVANSLLSELLLRATREGEVRDYYDIAVVGYSGEGAHVLQWRKQREASPRGGANPKNNVSVRIVVCNSTT